MSGQLDKRVLTTVLTTPKASSNTLEKRNEYNGGQSLDPQLTFPEEHVYSEPDVCGQ
jgi:hypothetical protein